MLTQIFLLVFDPVPEQLSFLSPEKPGIFFLVNLFDNFHVVLFKSPKALLLGQRVPPLLKLVDELLLNFAHVENEAVFGGRPVLEGRSDAVEGN